VKPSTTAAMWTVFTVAAVTTGLGAVTLVRNALTTPAATTLSQSEVTAQLATATPRLSPPPQMHSAQPTATHQSPSTTSGSPRTTSSTGSGSTTTGQTRTSSPPAGGQSSSPPAVSQTRTLASRGGTVVARCTAGKVYLTSWSPATGYRVEDVVRGPALVTGVWFEGPYEVHMRLTCEGGVPFAEVVQEANTS
jgi:hypothetical protein